MIFSKIFGARPRQNQRLGAGMTTGKLIILRDYFDENACISPILAFFCKKMYFDDSRGRESFYFF
jgi:hypothetical protein